jgi:CDP-6-deoxy-D-xylo-4-hexulose-3-dehydrase
VSTTPSPIDNPPPPTDDALPEGVDVDELRDEILAKVEQYYALTHGSPKPFKPGKTLVQYAGRVFDGEDMKLLVDSSLRFFLTAGTYARRLEKKLAKYVGVKHASLVNSGSSANLVAFSTLTSPRLGDKRILPGDEVITVAAGFPTTVAPIIQNRAVPVFVDVLAETSNIDPSLLEAARSDRTKAVFVAHTLGNPFDIDAVLAFCAQHDLWLIEDNCDALGTTYDSVVAGRTGRTGSFGHLATSSFYPAHHITTGEGGAVYTNDDELKRIMDSFRDWGRDCWCLPAQENTCGMRFEQQFGVLPFGYDHKYVYSHFGYNLKLTDMQAAVGVSQMDKVDDFVEARRHNYRELTAHLERYEHVLQLPRPTPKSDPSWFGYESLVREGAPFTRDEIVAHLESEKIQTRMLFAGNLLAHPCFDEMRESGDGYRVVGDLTNTDRIMNTAFIVGVYPGIDAERLEHVKGAFDRFMAKAGVEPR